MAEKRCHSCGFPVRVIDDGKREVCTNEGKCEFSLFSWLLVLSPFYTYKEASDTQPVGFFGQVFGD
jgi:hypothetical protein